MFRSRFQFTSVCLGLAIFHAGGLFAQQRAPTNNDLPRDEEHPDASETTSKPNLPAGTTFDDASDILFGTGHAPVSPGAPTIEELRRLLPAEPGASPPSAIPAPLTQADGRLAELARKVAPAVVSLRVWDGLGNELARGSGCFINSRGAILTDMQLVHPEFASRIEYITVSTGTGTPHRITGYHTRDLDTGLTVLQSDAASSSSLPFRREFDFLKERQVSIVAIHGERDLSLADAVVKADESRSGSGWLNLRGKDSPGEPGSPVIDSEGRVVALVSMRVPQGEWFNFGIRLDAVAASLAPDAEALPLPLARLAQGDRRPLAQDPRFLQAFRTLAEGNALPATSQFVILLKSHPRSAELWALLGLAFAKSGAKEEALNCNRKAVALDPRVGQYWYQLAVSHLADSAGKPNPAAREALEKTVEQRPADKLAWLLLAEQQLLSENYSAAEKALSEVAKLEPDLARASFLLGYTKGRQRDYTAAEEAMLRCVQLDRKHTRAWFYLALLYTKQKRFPQAVAAYETIVDVDPVHPSAWRNLALLHRKLGRETAATRAFERHQRSGAARR